MAVMGRLPVGARSLVTNVGIGDDDGTSMQHLGWAGQEEEARAKQIPSLAGCGLVAVGSAREVIENE